MNIGLLTPGFSADEADWAIPSLQNFVTTLARTDTVRVITLRYPSLYRPYTVGGAQVYPQGYGTAASGLKRLRLWQAALWLLRRLHREQPFDMLHAAWSDETGLLATWAGRWLRIPSVSTITGGELVGFNDIAYGSQRSRFGHWTVGQALSADAVVVNSSHSQRLIGKAGYIVLDSRIQRIVWGVDTNLFRPTDMPRDAKRLLHVGSLVGIKNQRMLLKALARLDESVRLDIVGEGPLQTELQALAAELGIAARVHFNGPVTYRDMPNYYQQASLLVMTSRNEGVPMATLEAGACGLPTVSTAVGILPDYPALGVTVPVDDDAALAAAIADLLADDTRRAVLGQSAYETVREQFSVEHTVEHYRELYAALVQQTKKG